MRTEDILQEVCRALAGVDQQRAGEFAVALAAAPVVFVTGQGRSGLMAAAFANRLAHLGKAVHLVGQPTTPPVGPGALVVACSGSGRTGVTLLHARRALEAGAQVWAVTQDAASPLAEAAGRALVIPDIPSAQPGASVFEQALLLLFDAVVVDLMVRLGETPEGIRARHANLE